MRRIALRADRICLHLGNLPLVLRCRVRANRLAHRSTADGTKPTLVVSAAALKRIATAPSARSAAFHVGHQLLVGLRWKTSLLSGALGINIGSFSACANAAVSACANAAG
jgi:hypothetical protein